VKQKEDVERESTTILPSFEMSTLPLRHVAEVGRVLGLATIGATKRIGFGLVGGGVYPHVAKLSLRM